MKSSKKSFQWLIFTIEVYITDSAPEGFREEAIAGVYPHETNSPVFKIWFKKIFSTETLVHECWHLYMTMLMAMDSRPHYFRENLNDAETNLASVSEQLTEAKQIIRKLLSFIQYDSFNIDSINIEQKAEAFLKE